MNRSAMIIVSIIYLATAVCFAVPMDMRAADILVMAQKKFAFRDRATPYTKSELSLILQHVNGNNVNVRMAAAIALAFDNSPKGTQALSTMAKDKESRIAGAARFAQLWKQVRCLKQEERLALLSFELGRRKNKWTKLFLIGKLGDEYGETVLPLFMTALETEKDSLVRAELYFQISCYGHIHQLKRIQKMLPKEPKDFEYILLGSNTMALNLVSTNKVYRDDHAPTRLWLTCQIQDKIKKREKMVIPLSRVWKESRSITAFHYLKDHHLQPGVDVATVEKLLGKPLGDNTAADGNRYMLYVKCNSETKQYYAWTCVVGPAGKIVRWHKKGIK